MKKHLSNILIGLIFAAGIVLLGYPTFSSVWNSYHQTRAVVSYSEEVKNLGDSTRDEIYQDALDYNESLLYYQDRWHLNKEAEELYLNTLKVPGTDVIGYLEIESIDVMLPVYHGTSSGVLQAGLGHLMGTSLPVGGESSHAVLSGHTGLPSSILLTNLTEVKEGDIFSIHTLDKILTYEVDQILVVLPDEMDSLVITPGMDYCTLITCTPYGINSHRLLVRGHRIQTPVEKENIEPKVDYTLYYWIGAAVLVLICTIFIFWFRKSRKKRKGK